MVLIAMESDSGWLPGKQTASHAHQPVYPQGRAGWPLPPVPQPALAYPEAIPVLGDCPEGLS